MATLTQILTADLAIPQAIETKFAFLPKLSAQMATVAAKVPAGPDLPGVAVTVLEPPPPNRAGQPLADFFNGPPITGPTMPGGTTAVVTAVKAKMPLSPTTPGATRGTIEYSGLPLSPTTPGAARGTILYGE